MLLIVLVTIPQNKAKTFTEILLKARVCACVNIIRNVESLFWWQGKINTEKEALLIIKTKNANFAKLKKTIKNNHPYSVPEIIAFKADKVDAKYLQWVKKEVRD